MNPVEYVRLLAEEFAQELTQVDRLKRWTKNPEILGAHAEQAVRGFVNRTISPMRWLSGSVVWELRCRPEHSMPQLDGMLVYGGPAPTLFESGDFALVPRDACHAVLEIKRSTYPGAGKRMVQTFSQLPPIFENLPSASVCGLSQRWLGVFCLRTSACDKEALSLIENGQAVALLKESENSIGPDVEGIFAFLAFLVRLREASIRLRHNPQMPSASSVIGTNIVQIG